MNKQTKEALEMAMREMKNAIPHLDIHLDDYFEAIKKGEKALAEAEKQEKEAQQDAEAWIKQLNNEIKNDAAKLTLKEGRKIMRALEALKEKND